GENVRRRSSHPRASRSIRTIQRPCRHARAIGVAGNIQAEANADVLGPRRAHSRPSPARRHHAKIRMESRSSPMATKGRNHALSEAEWPLLRVSVVRFADSWWLVAGSFFRFS